MDKPEWIDGLPFYTLPVNERKIMKKRHLLSRLLTNNHRDVPLLYIMFDLNKYLNDGAENSCTCYLHPSIGNDEFLVDMMNEMCDYIRDNYDMEDITYI